MFNNKIWKCGIIYCLLCYLTIELHSSTNNKRFTKYKSNTSYNQSTNNQPEIDDYKILSNGISFPYSTWPVTINDMDYILDQVTWQNNQLLPGEFYLIGESAEKQKHDAKIVAIQNGEIYYSTNTIYNQIMISNDPNAVNNIEQFRQGKKFFKNRENDILLDQFGNVWKLNRYVKDCVPLLCWQLLFLRNKSHSNFIAPDIVKQFGELVPLCDSQVNGQFKLLSKLTPQELYNTRVTRIKPRYGIIVHDPKDPKKSYNYTGNFRWQHATYKENGYDHYYNQEVLTQVQVGNETLIWEVDDIGNTFWLKKDDYYNDQLPLTEHTSMECEDN